jgi:hypothetical protein
MSCATTPPCQDAPNNTKGAFGTSSPAVFGEAVPNGSKKTAPALNRFRASRDSRSLKRFGRGEAAKGQLPLFPCIFSSLPRVGVAHGRPTGPQESPVEELKGGSGGRRAQRRPPARERRHRGDVGGRRTPRRDGGGAARRRRCGTGRGRRWALGELEAAGGGFNGGAGREVDGRRWASRWGCR